MRLVGKVVNGIFHLSVVEDSSDVTSSTEGDFIEIPASVVREMQETEGEVMAEGTKEKKYDNVTVSRTLEPRITIPEGMKYKTAREWLERIELDEESPVAIMASFEGFPLDGAYAFWKAMVDLCGFASQVPTPTLFGPKPPLLIDVPINHKESVKVPWGRIETPAIEGFLNTSVVVNPRPSFVLGGTVKKKNKPLVDAIIKKTQEILRTESIYRGRAGRVSFRWMEAVKNGERAFDPIQDAPRFMDVSDIKKTDLIFGDQVMAALDIGLFTLIERTEQCRRAGIPRKSGVLLAGPYGTGKSLTAQVTAKLCEENNWTFMYVDRASDLPHAIKMAELYAPCAVFCEDIDRATGGLRDEELDEFLNTIDGVDTKTKEVLCVFTTNNVHDIYPGMLRPGRVDTVVEVLPPDAKTAIRLVVKYARGLLAPDIDLVPVGQLLDGMIPATIRAVVEKAKTAALLRTGVVGSDVTAEDLIRAAHAMKNHMELVNRKPDQAPTAKELMSELGEAAGNAAGGRIGMALVQVAQVAASGRGGRAKKVEDQDVLEPGPGKKT